MPSVSFEEHNFFSSLKCDVEKQDALISRFYSVTQKNNQQNFFTGYRTHIIQRTDIKECQNLAKKISSEFENMLLLGVGGSALGFKTVLKAHHWKAPSGIKVYVSDNLDPFEINFFKEKSKLGNTAIIAISKSGSTLETIGQLFHYIECMKAEDLDWKNNIFCVSDPDQGPLRTWCTDNNIPCLSIPPETGGRFSVFSPAGLLPLAVCGFDIEEFLAGASEVINSFSLETSASIGWAMAKHYQQGRDNHVIMPYLSRLKIFGEWYVQLWGESLGKINTKKQAIGVTPINAIGDTDQHSLLQLLLHGPDKFITGFVELKNWEGAPVNITSLPKDFQKLSFAENQNFADLLSAQLNATKQTLADENRPTYKVILSELNVHSLGALMLLFMDWTVFSGLAMNVNPFDQPAVEKGKRILKNFL